MARSRNIKPGFFTNDVLGELPPLARLLFAGLWTICDREGRCEDRPKKIKAEVLPYDNCDADELLTMLEASGFIARYMADGVNVIQVLTWDKHQNPHVKEGKSTLPALDMSGASTVRVPDKEPPKPERAGLIPDSGSLIPDSSTSVAKATGAAAPTPPEVIFGLGVPLLTAANVSEANARKMLGMFRKQHGDPAVIAALQRCANEQPMEPVSWLQKVLKAPAAGQRAPPLESFRERDRKDAEAKVAFLTGRKPPTEVIEVEAVHVTPRALGREDLSEAVCDLRPSLPAPVRRG